MDNIFRSFTFTCSTEESGFLKKTKKKRMGKHNNPIQLLSFFVALSRLFFMSLSFTPFFFLLLLHFLLFSRAARQAGGDAYVYL